MVSHSASHVVVLRPFGGPDDVGYIAGQLLETADWPPVRLQRLTDMRMVRTATKEEIDTAEEVPATPTASSLKARKAKASGKKGSR